MPHARDLALLAVFMSMCAFAGAASLQQDAWRLELQLKASAMIVDPATGERVTVFDPLPDPFGLMSPDGTKVAFIGSDPARVKAGHDFDLFVADVDRAQPSGKASVRRLTTDQTRPSDVHWLKAGVGLAFLAQRSSDDANEAVWFIDLSPDAKPMLVSDEQCERAWQLSITPGDHMAYVQLNGRNGKEQSSDLIIRRPPNRFGRVAEGGGLKRVLHDQHISSYALSPDGKTLAWSGLGSMFLVNLDTGDSREIPLHGIHPQLLNHTVHDFAWRPDGQIIAMRCGFLGGVARAFNANPDANPNEAWPRMFAEDKLFLLPVSWRPTAEALQVGEGVDFPSPTADDPKADVSPAAGDESKPWWVSDLPANFHSVQWIGAADARDRIEQHRAPPETPDRAPTLPMPPES